MKGNKIEKLILDLSNRWDCSPQEAVDRLNSMNESELNKLVNSIEKHDWGGVMGFFKSLFPMYKQERVLWKNPKTKNKARTGYIKETLKTGNDSIIRMIGRPVDNPDTTVVDKNGNFYSSPYSEDPTWPTLSVEQWSKVNNKMDKAKEKSYGFKQGGLIDCLRAGGSMSKCKCGQTLKAQEGALVDESKVAIPRSPKGVNDNHDSRFWNNVMPKLGYDEYSMSTKTGLRYPGHAWINHDVRTAGEVTQNKYTNDSWNNPYLVVDNRINPNPNETPNMYVERWKNFNDKMKGVGIPDPGLAKYAGGGVAQDNKVRRTDAAGYAYTMPNGVDVLTQDAVGLQPAPGSYSTVKGSSPEVETQRRRRTDKGGNVKYDLYKVFVNDGDHYGPVARYTTKRTLWDPRTWFARLLTEKRANEMQTAYDVNNLKCGGEINQLPKQKKNYLKK